MPAHRAHPAHATWQHPSKSAQFDQFPLKIGEKKRPEKELYQLISGTEDKN
jgi:hypothetical protein